MKRYSGDDDINAKIIYFNGGFQLILTNNLTMDVLTGLVSGDMDAGETDISGLNLSFVLNYGF